MIPVRYNIRSLFVRKATTLATAVGIGLVVFVLGAALMLSAGIKKTLGGSGSKDIAIVMRKGSDAELGSGLEDSQVGLVKALPGVAHDSDQHEIAVGEVVVVTAMEKLGATGVSNVQLRGMPADGMKFRANAKIIEGNAAKPGTDEAVVGKRIRGRFKNLDLGQSFDIRRNRPVKIVGVFEDGGSSYESEVWADVDTVRTAFGRPGVSSVRVKLESESKFDGFKTAVESDKQLGLMTLRESEYYEKQSEGTSIFIGVMGTVVAVFFSIGAMIGAMNTMYAAVASRTREIGILRALGFSRIGILFSFLMESVALALIGGVIGVAGCMAMGAVKFSMMNFASWSEMVFTFEPTPQVIVTAFIAAGAMGLLGGFFPAIRAARTSPIAAMRGA
jgi:putative ABC transport system permease protein